MMRKNTVELERFEPDVVFSLEMVTSHLVSGIGTVLALVPRNKIASALLTFPP